MRKVFLLLFLFVALVARAQQTDSMPTGAHQKALASKDTTPKKSIIKTAARDSSKKNADTAKASRKAKQKDTVAATIHTTTQQSATLVKAPSTLPVQQAEESPISKSLAAYALQWAPAKIDLSIYYPKEFFGNTIQLSNKSNTVLHQYLNNDALFYCLAGLVLLLGIIKTVFSQYFNHIFWFFVQPNARKKTAAEQLSGQNIVPSLLLNLLFVLVGGLFIAQLSLGKWGDTTTLWTLWLSFSIIVAAIYLSKYIIVKLSGWIFNTPLAAAIYNNVVFSINKIIGLLLLPASILVAYGTAYTASTVYTLVSVLIVILLLYRYIASFMLIKGKLKINAFHFILYLCAVEIVPLLLAYKMIITNVDYIIQ